MTNEVQTTTNAAAAVASLKAGMANVKQAVPTSNSMGFLKMSKLGTWSFGAENLQVEDGSEWAVSPLSLRHGWVAWKRYPDGDARKSSNVGEVLVPMSSPPVRASDLEDLKHHEGDGATASWSEAVSVSLKCLNGADEGEEVIYTVNSYGGRQAVGNIIDALYARLDTDPVNFVPVVELSSDSYVHGKWGETVTPLFKLVDWISLDGPEAVAAESSEAPQALEKEPEPAPEPKAKAAPRRARKAAVAKEPVAVAEPEQPAEEPAVKTRTRTRRAR